MTTLLSNKTFTWEPVQQSTRAQIDSSRPGLYTSSFEVALVHLPTNTRFLCHYTSRRNTYNGARPDAEQIAKIVELIGETELGRMSQAKFGEQKGFKGTDWAIQYTGRTKLDAYQEGRLPFILNVTNA